MQMICIKLMEADMKYKKAALVLALGVVLSACNNQKPVENNKNIEITEDTNQNMESVSVYASFFPIYNLTKQVAGDKFDVKSFANLKTESHGWEPSAKDIAELSNSELMFINGAGMEEWEESLESSSDIELVDTSENIELIEGSHDHDSDHEDEDYDHNHGEFDPHTWLSPKNGIAQARVIAEKLSEIDPTNKDYYMDNYKKIEENLNAMIDEYTKKFNNLDNKNFLVSHQAFGYLAHDFDLNQIALTSLGATEDADAKTLRDAINKAEDLGINTVFYEMGGSDKSAKTIADEIDATIVPLNTLEFATDEELNNGTSYQDLIEYNLEELYKSMEK
mgnify:FL=1